MSTKPRYVAIDADELREMEKELKELREKSISYDAYLEKHGEVWLGPFSAIEALTPEQKEWLERHARERATTNPSIALLKSTAMQHPEAIHIKPSTPDSFDGSKVDMAGMDEGTYQWSFGKHDRTTTPYDIAYTAVQSGNMSMTDYYDLHKSNNPDQWLKEWEKQRMAKDAKPETLIAMEDTAWHDRTQDPDTSKDYNQWQPKEGEEFWVRLKSGFINGPYINQNGLWIFLKEGDRKFPTKEAAEAYGLKSHVDNGGVIVDISGNRIRQSSLPKFQSNAKYEYSSPDGSNVWHYATWDSIVEIMGDGSNGWHIKPATPSTDQILAELHLGHAYKINDLHAWSDPQKQGVVFGNPSTLKIISWVPWDEAAEVIERHKNWVRA